MTADIGFACLGLVILLLAGDARVKGAVNLALRVGIPALLVSLTIVAFGTSAPELLISVSAILDGAAGIAIGNVVGSNIANVLLVLGVPAVMAGLATSNCETRKSYVFMMIATVVFIALCFFGPLTCVHGLILLALLFYVLFDAFRSARSHRKDAKVAAAIEDLEDVEGADPSMAKWKIAVYLILGLIGLPLGANLLVDASINIARTLHVSDEIIGLTLIAIGTSLPELATTVMAALRRQADVALGNVIGSNMFNLLAIIGISTLVGPIPVDKHILMFDIWVMLGASLILAPFVFMKKDMGRVLGLSLSVLYILYLVLAVS
jgi:cation:H+ antiporter